MIGNIEFFRLPGSLTTGEYPVMTRANINLTSYRVARYTRCKYSKDFRQRIVIPEFDAWTTCNLCRLTSGNWIGWYWISDRSQSSNVNEAVEFAIEYNPVTTLMSKGGQITGYWTRVPTDISPYKGQAVMSGAMQEHKWTPIHEQTAIAIGFVWRLMWVSLTTSKPIHENGKGSGLFVYGWPIAVSDNAYAGSGSYNFDQLQTYVSSSMTLKYPTLQDVMSNPGLFAPDFAASDIVDIAVLPFIPYKFASGAIDNKIYAYIVEQNRIVASKTNEVNFYVGVPTPARFTTRVPIDDLTQKSGAITIRTPDGATLSEIPTAWVVDDVLTVEYQGVCDIGQSYIRYYIGNSIIQAPGIHIPYVGTAWDTYRAYSLALDREALQSSIDYAHDRLNVQTNAGIANGAIGAISSIATGDIGGAVSSVIGQGVQIATSYRMQDISDSEARYRQDLTERRIQAQPSSTYCTSQGLSGIINALLSQTCIAESIPTGLTARILSDYIDRYGYSVEGKATLTIGNGFFQGMLESTSSMCGGEFDRLNEAFMHGLRIIEVRS